MTELPDRRRNGVTFASAHDQLGRSGCDAWNDLSRAEQLRTRRAEIFAALEAGSPIPPLPPVEPLDLGDPDHLVTTGAAARILGLTSGAVTLWRVRGFLAVATDTNGAEIRNRRGYAMYRIGDIAEAEAVTRGRSGRPKPEIDSDNRGCA